MLSETDSEKPQAILEYIRSCDDEGRESSSYTSAYEQYEVSTQRKQRQQRLTAAEIKQIVVRFLAGEKTTELAEAFGCSRSTISHHLHKAGHSAREKRSTEEQLRKMQRLYETGLSLDKVGERFGTTGTTATKYLREFGVQIRARHEWLR